MRASEEYLSWMIALVILSPVAIIIFLIYLFGTVPITNSLSQSQSYVNFLTLSQKTGEIIVTPGLSPSLPSNKFMMQIYVNSTCLSYLDTLSRVAVLSYPSNPNTLINNFAICIGSLSNNVWPYSSNSATLQNAFPFWIGYTAISSRSAILNGFSAFNAYVLSVNGSKGSFSFYNTSTASQAQQIMSYNCVRFLGGNLNSQYAFQYVNSLQCSSLGNSFISITNNCTESTCYQPFAFMHGSPAEFQYQECKYSSGNYECYTLLI
ncbi:MAG: hypothetical protein QXP36_08815 [Conexivisphaerales archaeon]